LVINEDEEPPFAPFVIQLAVEFPDESCNPALKLRAQLYSFEMPGDCGL
jgi:hypothetical protein